MLALLRFRAKKYIFKILTKVRNEVSGQITVCKIKRDRAIKLQSCETTLLKL